MNSFSYYFYLFLGYIKTLIFYILTFNLIVFYSGFKELALFLYYCYFCFFYYYYFFNFVLPMFYYCGGLKDGNNCVFKYVINLNTGCCM